MKRMNKHEFLSALRARLSALPLEEVLDRLSFYGEMIDDRMEEGLSEEEAVSAVGTVDEIAARILSEPDRPARPAQAPQAEREATQNAKQETKQEATKEAIKNRSTSPWVILLLVLGFPLWLPLLLVAGCVLLTVYVVLWAPVASAWAVFASLAACALAGLASGIIFLSVGHPFSGLIMLSGALICAGLAIFAFLGCLAATGGSVRLTAQIGRGIGRVCKNWRHAA